MRHWLQIIRKKLFGGHSDVEIERERKSWRDEVHAGSDAAQKSIATAMKQRKKSNEALQIAEEVVQMLADNVEKQKQIREKIQSLDKTKNDDL